MYNVRHKSKPADMLVVQTCAAGLCLGMLLISLFGVLYTLHATVGNLV